MERLDLMILNILQLELFGKTNKMIQDICPKCQGQFKERDNFCAECGKDLKIIKIKNSKLKEKYGKRL